MIGLGLSIVQIAVRQFLGFSPRSLFAGGAKGVWYDPSDFSTLFTTSAGTTPVTGVEQDVGLMLDKSQGLVLGSELVTNGDFSNGSTGWTYIAGTTNSASVVSGQLVFTAAGAGPTYATYRQGVLTVGKWYQIEFDLIALGASPGNNIYIEAGGSGLEVGTTLGRRRIIRTAVGTNLNIIGIGGGSIDNISVREIAGNHAFQSTDASRPRLSARYNLLTKTEQFSDSAWVKTNLTLTTGVADPFGGANATTLTASGGAGRIYQGATVPASVSMGMGIWVRRRTGTGTITFEALSVGVGPTITPTASWQLVSATGSTPVTTGYYGIRIDTPGDAIDVFGASLVPANQSTIPYQRVNTATDYDTTGFLPYLKFDGVDDSLSTNSISFTSTDKMSVFAGVRKLSSATFQIIAELGTDSYSNAGSFGVFPTGPVMRSESYGTFLRGSDIGYAGFGPYTAPITNVLEFSYNIGASGVTNEIVARINGATVGYETTGGNADTGNFGNYPLFIGRRNNTNNPFNGQLYSMIIVGKAVTAGELSSTETYVNQKTGAY